MTSEFKGFDVCWFIILSNLGTILGTATAEVCGPVEPLDPPDAALCWDFWDSLSHPFKIALTLAHLSLAETFSFSSFESFSSFWAKGGRISESGDCFVVSRNCPEWFIFKASWSRIRFADFFAFLLLLGGWFLSKGSSNLNSTNKCEFSVVNFYLSGSDIE